MKEFEREAKRLKAFCDPNRLLILEQLRSGEKCACHLLETLAISQPTLSHHMKILLESEVVKGRKMGKWMHYKLSEDGLNQALQVISKFSEPSVMEIKTCCDSKGE